MKGSYQKQNTWETTKKQTRFSNYSGHHMKGSYQKQKTHGKNKNKQQKQNDFQTSLAQGPPEPD